MALQLKIVTPEKVAYNGEATLVKVPGMMGEFEILTSHAPIVSVLNAGVITYDCAEGSKELKINGGFVSVKRNQVNVCVEL